MGRDILIPNKRYRNRAISGDKVAVQLLPEHLWTGPSGIIRRQDVDEEKEESNNNNNTNSDVISPASSKRKVMPTGMI